MPSPSECSDFDIASYDHNNNDDDDGRSDTCSLNGCINITNDPDLYFQDGNLVILTRDDDGNHTYFRVHQSILSKHSKTLSDLTKSKSPADVYDGVPVVELHEDANDLKLFLKFLYEPLNSAAPLQRGDPDIAYKMFGPLRLADKFLIAPLKNTILAYIREDWPLTLQAWDEREALYARRLKHAPPGATMDDISPEPASVIRLARMFEPRLLTTAFYHLSRLPLHTSYSATSVPDVVYHHHQNQNQNQNHRLVRGVRVHLLSPADRERVTLGRERMLRWIADRLEASSLDAWQCPVEEGCHIHIYWRVVVLHRSLMRSKDLLATLKAMRSSKVERGTTSAAAAGTHHHPVQDAVCGECNVRWDQVLASARSDFFDALPTFFPDL